MKVTLVKFAKKKEVINRLDLETLVEMIRSNPERRGD